MLTYNQEEYIVQAIESVLKQRTNFPVELVIGEDHSTDTTRDICRSFAAKYPHKIKLLLNQTNLGLGANYVKTLNECTGKYVAICDGDDYWTDPFKLQKQVDFLESHSEFEIVFTNNKNVYPSGAEDVRDLSEIPLDGGFETLVFQNYIASVTVMFKNRSLPESMKNWISKLPYVDWPTYLWVVRNGGRIGLIDEVTAVYRKDFGTSTALRKGKSTIGELNLNILQRLKNEPAFSSRLDLIDQSIIKYKTGLMVSYNKEGNFSKSLRYLFNLLTKTKQVRVLKLYFYSLKTSFSN